MKTRLQKKRPVTIPRSRWLAYAGAGAATALTGATSAEAEIHYSGRVNVVFLPDDNKSVQFPLDQAGDSLVFEHRTFNGAGGAYFKAVGLASGAFLGTYSQFSYAYVFRIKSRGRYISRGPFTSFAGSGFNFGIMIDSNGLGQWDGRGIGFVGFRFNNGSGSQYGWARVHMKGEKANRAFEVLDYAYADPGEPIVSGQTTSSSWTAMPDKGSLGWLALGAVGLLAWRKGRSRAAR